MAPRRRGVRLCGRTRPPLWVRLCSFYRPGRTWAPPSATCGLWAGPGFVPGARGVPVQEAGSGMESQAWPCGHGVQICTFTGHCGQEASILLTTAQRAGHKGCVPHSQGIFLRMSALPPGCVCALHCVMRPFGNRDTQVPGFTPEEQPTGRSTAAQAACALRAAEGEWAPTVPRWPGGGFAASGICCGWQRSSFSGEQPASCAQCWLQLQW